MAAPALLLVAVALAGCSSAAAEGVTDGAAGGTPGGTVTAEPASGSATASASASATGNPYGASPVDPPGPDEPILSVGGGRTDLSLSLEQLERLGTVDVIIDEPFVKQRQSFTGVPLERVLDAAGIPATADLLTIALNDYRYAAPATELIASRAIIATRREGAAIPYDQGGPIRLIFPDGSPLASVLDAWNWSLAEIRVQ